MAILASSTLSNAPLGVNYQLMKGFLSTARKRLPFFNGTLPGALQKNGSASSVKWERIENLSPNTTALTEPAGTVSAFFGRNTELPSMSVVTAAMAKYGSGVLLTEEVDVYQMNPVAARYMDILGAQAGESLNRLMEAVYSTGLTNVRYCNGSTGGTADTNVISSITLNDIKWAHALLNRNSAMKFQTAAYGSQNVGTSPIRSSYYGICHTDVEEDIRALSGFISVEQYGGYTDTLPHEFGAVGGVRWSSTEIIPITTGGGTTSVATNYRGASATANDVYSVYIYGKEAVGSVGLGNQYATSQAEMFDPARPPAVEFITKGKGQIGTDLFNEYSAMTWKAWFAGAVLNTSWGVKLRCLSAEL